MWRWLRKQFAFCRKQFVDYCERFASATIYGCSESKFQLLLSKVNQHNILSLTFRSAKLLCYKIQNNLTEPTNQGINITSLNNFHIYILIMFKKITASQILNFDDFKCKRPIIFELENFVNFHIPINILQQCNAIKR